MDGSSLVGWFDMGCDHTTNLLLGYVFPQDASHEAGNAVTVFLQGEVARVGQVELHGLQVALVGLAAATLPKPTVRPTVGERLPQ